MRSGKVKSESAVKRLYLMVAIAALIILVAACNQQPKNEGKEKAEGKGSASKKEVVVYSSRTEELIKPAFDAFTKKTGIKVRYTTGKEEELFERLQAEGSNTPADMLMTVDAGNLWLASNAGLLQPISSDVLDKNIAKNLRDSGNEWVALTVRARPIQYSTERVKPSELSTYEALGDKKWKGRLGLRTSEKVYTKSLLASMIASLGPEKTEKIVQGWMDNDPVIFDSDTDMLKAIEAGQIDVGVANSYYLGRLIKEDVDFPVTIFWPNQDDRGAHVNVSGAGITKHAPNKKGAVELLEFLSGPIAQKSFGDVNLEYPVNSEVDLHEILEGWGEFKRDDLNVSELGKNQVEAVKLADRVGYR